MEVLNQILSTNGIKMKLINYKTGMSESQSWWGLLAQDISVKGWWGLAVLAGTWILSWMLTKAVGRLQRDLLARIRFYKKIRTFLKQHTKSKRTYKVHEQLLNDLSKNSRLMTKKTPKVTLDRNWAAICESTLHMHMFLMVMGHSGKHTGWKLGT